LLIYLTARDESKGRQALNDIHSDQSLRDLKVLRSEGGLTDVDYHPLDISDDSSICAFRDFLKKEHSDGIDFGTPPARLNREQLAKQISVINNAGIALDGFSMRTFST
jgi:carbonyl reductase 1